MKTVVLVSCVGKKLSHPAPAARLYHSAWFGKARAYAEFTGDEWYILSAKHGLLHPEQVIEPYDATLNAMPADERKRWADMVLRQVVEHIPGCSRVVVLAGRRYRERLVGLMRESGYAVEVPMEGMGIGQQEAWLAAQVGTPAHFEPRLPVDPKRDIPPPGVPCRHRGCLGHISHPCEVCGRIGGIPRERLTEEKETDE